MTTNDEVLARATRISAATLHEAAGQVGALPSAIKPLASGFRVCGRAFPVSSPPGDNLWIHRAIYRASPGDVLVVDAGEATEHGHWGEIMTHAAVAQKLEGLVIDGGVRDVLRLRSLGFPVFARAVCIGGTTKDPTRMGSIGKPITIGGASIALGDLVIGDADGVVVVPWNGADRAVDAAVDRDTNEAAIIERVRNGESTLQIFDLPDGS